MERDLVRRQLILFFSFAYALAWIFLLPLGLSKAGLGWIPWNLSLPVMATLATLGPTLSALITLRLTEHRWPRRRFVGNPKRLLLALLLCPVLLAIAYAVIPALLLAKVAAATLSWTAAFSLSFYNWSTLVGAPLGEEPGWRGFALRRLQRLMGPLPAALLLGVLWAAWHLPLFLCTSWSTADFPTFLIIIISLSLIMAFLFNLSTGSVVVAIAAHALFNTTSSWLNAILGHAPLREWLVPERTIGIGGVIVATVLVSITRGRLGAARPAIGSTPVRPSL